MAIRIGSRVVNQYTLSPKCGLHGKVIRFKAGMKDWEKYWAYIQYDDGTEGTEMKRYLIREDEVQRIVCPKCHGTHGYRAGAGFEGSTYEINFKCTDCKYDWWIPEYLLKRMKVPEES